MPLRIESALLSLLRLRGYRRRWLAGGRLHGLEVAGEGTSPPVLLLHGLSSCAADFAPVIRLLRPRVRRILALDLPGHGWSGAPEAGASPEDLHQRTLQALDEWVTEPTLVVGNSLGGVGAVRYGLARPERVLGLALFSPAGAPMAADDLADLLSPFRADDPAAARAFMGAVLARPSPLKTAVLGWGAARRMQAPGVRAFVAAIRPDALLRPDELAALVPPTLLVWGEAERLLPESHLEFYQAHLPRAARVVRPAALGHAPFTEDPRRAVDLIFDFLSEINPENPATHAA